MKQNLWRNFAKFSVILALALVVGGDRPPAFAQTRQAIKDAEDVYQLLPNFPQENQYISQDSGEIASQNTLVARLIYYHIYLKNRPPQYRFDWKLTLADYLGANETILSSRYSGTRTLRDNPLKGDIAIIDRLTRQQREELIQTLVRVFNPNIDNNNQDSSSPLPDNSESQPNSPNSSGDRRFPKPGDAQLLL
ncbi:hypothetical protein [Spirulina sp. 06S082]|uniref:hypothetical protein n=1 Tax=Spirulina sp. 06S082 TaxID=3110248 RepID=UPI002B1FB539|nr:hypothetical protein [Spirulina sp. 06S082]MEA5470419.1 hypothetical protein [Spirulina sp. 06S082]